MISLRGYASQGGNSLKFLCPLRKGKASPQGRRLSRMFEVFPSPRRRLSQSLNLRVPVSPRLPLFPVSRYNAHT